MEVIALVALVGVVLYLATTKNPNGRKKSKKIKIEAPELTVTNVISAIEVIGVVAVTLWVVI